MIQKITSSTQANIKNQTNFKALRAVEYLGSFSPGIKQNDLEVLKAVQESKAITRFCKDKNVVLYLSKDCIGGEYTSKLIFSYKNIAKNLKSRIKNILTPKKELNIIYKSNETSSEHSKTFQDMINNLQENTLEEMASINSK